MAMGERETSSYNSKRVRCLNEHASSTYRCGASGVYVPELSVLCSLSILGRKKAHGMGVLLIVLLWLDLEACRMYMIARE